MFLNSRRRTSQNQTPLIIIPDQESHSSRSGRTSFQIIFETDEINELSQALSEQVSGELSRFRDITVIGYYSMEMMALIRQNILEAARSLGADYIITGSLQYYAKPY